MHGTMIIKSCFPLCSSLLLLGSLIIVANAVLDGVLANDNNISSSSSSSNNETLLLDDDDDDDGGINIDIEQQIINTFQQDDAEPMHNINDNDKDTSTTTTTTTATTTATTTTKSNNKERVLKVYILAGQSNMVRSIICDNLEEEEKK